MLLDGVNFKSACICTTSVASMNWLIVPVLQQTTLNHINNHIKSRKCVFLHICISSLLASFLQDIASYVIY